MWQQQKKICYYKGLGEPEKNQNIKTWGLSLYHALLQLKHVFISS